MIHAVTFSDSLMSRAAALCCRSAEQYGAHFAWRWTHLEFQQTKVYKDNPVLHEPRGLGFWGWKPYIILRTMTRCQDGDVVIYADAGVEFVDNVNYIIERMDQDIWLFGNMYEHAHWCKADLLEEIIPWSTGNPDLAWRNTKYTLGKQAQASVIFFRVSDCSGAFVKEWLDWCLFDGGRLIDDSPSTIRNHPEFRENRHDQAILTTMAYRDGIKLHWWPAMYNDGQFIYERGEYADEGYPVLFHHHRKRDHEWSNAA